MYKRQIDKTVYDATNEDMPDDNDNFFQLIAINTNTRTLCPKINSLIGCFDELKANLGVITETLQAEGEGLEEDAKNIVNCADIGMIYKNRPVNQRRIAHSGVAIFFRKSKIELKQFKMDNPGGFEVFGWEDSWSKEEASGGCLLYPSQLYSPKGQGCPVSHR